FVVELDGGERRLRLAPRQAVGASARQFASFRRLVEIGRPERVRLDADLIDEGQPPRRAGSEHELGTSDDHCCNMTLRIGAEPNGYGLFRQHKGSVSRRLIHCRYSLPLGRPPNRVLMCSVSWSRTA